MMAPDPDREADAFIRAAKAFTWRPRVARLTPNGLRLDATVAHTGALLPVVDLRTRGLISPPKNQHLTNACTSFAIAAAAEAAVAKSGSRVLLSPWYIHTCVLNADPSDGVYVADALHALEGRGIAYTKDSNAAWPPAQCNTTKVQLLRGRTLVGDEQNAKQALAAGYLVIVVAEVKLDDFRRLPKELVYRYRPDIHGESHTLCLAGYDDTRGCWLALNSFGSGWSNEGFGLLGYQSCGLFHPGSGDKGKGVCLLV